MSTILVKFLGEESHNFHRREKFQNSFLGATVLSTHKVFRENNIITYLILAREILGLFKNAHHSS